MVLKVAIGSKNPSKMEGVRRAFEKMFNDKKVEILGYSVTTTVHPQPVGLNKTIRGAIERALKAKKKAGENKDFYVGIEAGLIKIPGTISGYMDFQVAAVIDLKDKLTLGFGPGFEFPTEAVKFAIEGKGEVEIVMEKISGIEKIGEKIGAIGFLTKELIDRAMLTEIAVIMALIPRINEKHYEKFPLAFEVLQEL